MSTLIDAAAFTANEIYELQSTDSVEGAAIGANFGGVGNDNQPHQQLANRTAFLKGRQDTNISSIAALQAFIALATGSMGASGFLKLPFTDISKGLIQAIIQWGLATPGGGMTQDGVYTVAWPTPFTSACFAAIATLSYPTGDSKGGNLIMEVVSLGKLNGVFESNWTGFNGATPETGFYYAAIGY